MREVLILMATSMTEEKIIADIEEAIAEWKIFKDEERREKIVFNSQLLMLRTLTKGDMKKAFKVIKDVGKIDDIAKAIVNNEN